MQKAIDRGALAEMFRKFWKLEGVPAVTGLECEMIKTASPSNTSGAV